MSIICHDVSPHRDDWVVIMGTCDDGVMHSVMILWLQSW